MTADEKPDTCDGRTDATGRCDPTHPLHCCHFVTAARRSTGHPDWILVGFICEKCKRPSRSWIKRRRPRGNCEI